MVEHLKGDAAESAKEPVEFENEAYDSFGTLKNIDENIDIARTILEKREVIRKSIQNDASAGRSNALIVYDGSLYKRYSQENSIYSALENKDIITGNNLIGFCKSSNLLSDFSSPEILLAKQFHDYDVWLYRLSENISFAKLHPNSKHVFRIDSKDDISKEIFDSLAMLSCDSSFQGYPYPLIVADRFARVTNQEIARVRLISGAYTKKWDVLLKDAHKVLDTMEF